MTDQQGYNTQERLYRLRLSQTGDTCPIDSAIERSENIYNTIHDDVLRDILKERINKLKTIRMNVVGRGRPRKKRNTFRRRHRSRRGKTRRRRSRSR